MANNSMYMNPLDTADDIDPVTKQPRKKKVVPQVTPAPLDAARTGASAIGGAIMPGTINAIQKRKQMLNDI